MAPTLHDGDWVLYAPGTPTREVHGQVILCRHPYQKQLIIKRVSGSNPGTEELYLTGDNPDESTDSRSFGTIRRHQVIGIVIAYRSGG